MDGGHAGAGILERPTVGAPSAVDSLPTSESPPIGPDAPVIPVMATTRAMRRLAPDPVPDELLRSVVEAATWAPSAANMQLVQFVVVTDRDKIARLAPLWERVVAEWLAILAASGIDLADPTSNGKTLASVEWQRDHFTEVPAVIVVCEDTSATQQRSRSRLGTMTELSRRVGPVRALRLARAFVKSSERSYGASIFPAVENLLIAARAYGLGATLTTWHLFAEDEFKSVLEIPARVRTYAIVPIGWPLGRFGRVNRRPVDEVLHRDRW